MEVRLATAAVVLLLAVPTGQAQVPEGPEGIRLAYGEDTETVTVTFSGPPAAEALVQITGPGGETRAVEAEAGPLPGDDEVAYRATLSGLEPATNYTYVASLDGTESDGFAFQTPPPADAETPVRLTVFGDQGVPAPEPHPDRTDGESPLRNAALAANLSPDAHVLPGDISYADGDPEIWDVYFDKMEPYWATTPLMTVPGNHEREAGQGYTQYDARLTMPEVDGVGRWWTVQIGNVQLVGLNSDTACVESQAVQVMPTVSHYCGGRGASEDARQPNERQLAFVERTLSAADEDETVDWTIVQYHNPTYSTGSHGSNPDVQALWVPLFEEHGVDLVLNGDDHLYQRTQTLQGGEPAEEGPVYVVNGLGGSDTYDFADDEEDRPGWEAHRFNDEYGTLVLDAYEDRLESRFVTLEGDVVDPFTLVDGANGSAHVLEEATAAGDVDEEAEDAEPEVDDEDEGVLAAPAVGAGAGLAALLAAAVALARRRHP